MGVKTILANGAVTIDEAGTVTAPIFDGAATGVRTTTGPTSLPLGAVADGEFLKRVGATIVGAAGAGGTTITSGQATLSFGAFPGAAYEALAVAGQAGIVGGSMVEVWVRPAATADHTADEHIVDPPRVVAGDIVAATGFTIHAFSTNHLRHHGEYNIAWSWY